MDLSIIIPVWNEENKIRNDIIAINDFFSKNNRQTEIILVDDGSSDKTKEIIMAATSFSSIRVAPLILKKHCGKGYAVRQGVLNAEGRFIMFMDSGLTVPLKFIENAIQQLNDKNLGFIIGSRHLPESKIGYSQNWYRKAFSASFRFITKRLLGLPDFITDTQCGFKVFKRDVAKQLFQQSQENGYLFDLEIILLALRSKIPFAELAIEWNWDRDTRLSVGKTSLNIMHDLYYLKQRFL
ncbi:MAG: glycosyltransferase [Calditrichaeota bacterium]|nr:glycosyltransferase [Calditrichota bacterium]